ncbi:hypothetical protein [Falsiroseomonas sp.]|jgi:hypothetical protein|uniref:hypothetical protein n=1 Tax=Falsiroseomonas sp. TaxID=2870721 RepID=UPI0027349FCC|nr:hypothetical protein [Falsiroseomonas sp.]MDP3415909.1 hypothetical protein [Falsiroseomonas sp.]
MLRWVVGIAVLLAALGFMARMLQLGVSLALLGVALVAGVIGLVMALITWMQRRDPPDAR